MSKLHTHLWFDTEAEAAMVFYLSVFRDGRRLASIAFDGTEAYEFEVLGHKIIAINAGANEPFNERVCLYVETRDQAETDYFWNALTEGGEERPCGWLVDKFGVSWQVAPEAVTRLLADPDRAKANRVLQAFYRMKKVVIADLEAAAIADAA
jgi:predicted 3-demethylubiquinone-9 3-methyltransferase (glyoxalase superfamily)